MAKEFEFKATGKWELTEKMKRSLATAGEVMECPACKFAIECAILSGEKELTRDCEHCLWCGTIKIYG